jgi:3'-phosphoadenosine 5'-phosphosulfate sulfotransferase (PAPS reductase)/FAD synthetase
LDFINDCAVNWNVNVRWLELDIHDERPIFRTKEVTYETASRNGEPFAALIRRKKMLPNPMARMCTGHLKIDVMNRFMRSHGYKEWANVIGLRYDEPSRVARQRKNNETKKNRAKWSTLVPLYDYKVMVEDVARFWKNNDFDLKLPNHQGKTLAGNCDLCFLKGTKTLIKIVREKPELADWWIEQEKIVPGLQGNKETSTQVFSKTRTYKDLVEMAKLDAKQVELFDDDSRSCFCHD